MTMIVHGSDPLPDNRKIDWTKAGVPSSFVMPTNVYTTLPAGSTRAQILSALSASTNGSYVLLEDGTYNMDDRLQINSGKWLFGTSSNTIIDGGLGTPVSIGNWKNWEQETTNSNAGHTNWIAGFTKGATTITLTNADAFEVGHIIILDSLNDTNASVFGNSDSGNDYSIYEYTSETYTNNGHDRCQFQVNRITGKSGNDLTLELGLYKDFDPSLSPQVWRLANTPTTNAGICNLTVQGGSSDGILGIDVAYGCTISNVWVRGTSSRGYAYFRYCFRCTARHNQTIADIAGLDSYGIRTRVCSAMLVENNYGDKLRAPFAICGVSGSVWSYNFATNCQTNGFFFQPGFLQHGGFPWANLYEGNFAPSAGGDDVWGGSKDITWFRNQFLGMDSEPGGSHGNRQAAGILATNRYHSFIGNILGYSALTNYEDSGVCNGSRVYYLGPYDPGNGCSGVYDPIVKSSILRILNHDSATMTNNGLVLGGYTINDLTNSYYLTNKPAWIGFLPWPIVNPTNSSVDITNLPAGYRYVYGIDPPATSPAPPMVVSKRARVRK